MNHQMKNSGIEWIGEIPEHWDINRIGQVYSERREKVSDKDYAPLSVTMQGIVPQLSTAAKSDAHDDRKLVCKGDFAINSRSDRRGSCGISEYEGSVSLINTILTPKEDMDADYYNWLFHTSMFADEFYKWGHGIVNDLWTTGWQEMKRISIPQPPVSEQRIIADFLNRECKEIDQVIEQTRSSIDDYKKLKQELISRTINNGLREIRERKDTGIQWFQTIPKSWNVLKINRVGRTSSGATPLRSKEADYFEDASIRWVRTLDLNDGIVEDSSEKITELALQNSSCSIMPEGTVCVAMYGGAGTIGKSGLLAKQCATNQAICSIVCDEQIIRPKFLLFELIAIRPYWMVYAVGTRKDPNISQDIVGKMKIVVPPLDEQDEIINYLTVKCNSLDRLIQKKEQFVSELEGFKKAFIYEYVTGKKEVPHS